MTQLAIKGHEKRGNEVIEILKILGGHNNSHHFSGRTEYNYYYIGKYNTINCIPKEKIDSSFVTFTLEQFLEKYPYKVGDKVKNARINDFVGRVTNVRWDSNEEQIIYVVEWDDATRSTLTYFARGLQPYKEETMEEITIDIPKGYEFAGVDDNRQQVVFTKIQPEYPKTYEECHKLMVQWKEYDCNPNSELILCDAPIHDFCKLLVARNVYWKIAGEQMGLGKPWEPDWESGSITKYIISQFKNKIELVKAHECNYVFAFPTAEMRDAFYYNFKELIEKCKELL